MSNQHSKIRVLCVDDHRLVLDGLALIIGGQQDLEVVGLAASGEEAIALFRSLRPDVTLMDLQLPTISGLQAIHCIRHEDPDAHIVVLTMYQGDEDIHRALEAGATTYLLKDMLSDDLIRVIREVSAGARPMNSDIKTRLAARATRGANLTSREREVIELISQGLRNKEIAVALNISEKTVEVHVKKIHAKLEVHDRTAAINIALRRGIIHIS